MIRLVKNEFIKNFALLRGLVFLTIFSIFAFFITESSFRYEQKSQLISDSSVAQENLTQLEQKYKSNPTNDNLYAKNVAVLNAELEIITNKLTLYEQGWQLNIIDEILIRNNALAALKMIKDGIEANSFQYGLVYKNDRDEEINTKYEELNSINEKQTVLMALFEGNSLPKYPSFTFSYPLINSPIYTLTLLWSSYKHLRNSSKAGS